ncbi:MAG: hypothetical protein LDL41_04755 [Coleofasciculus sp. S288]|nr:hypothetical protein [Coleofasciculus sp. S288]
MSNQEFYTSLPVKINLEEISQKEDFLDFTETDEVRENVVGFRILVTLGKIIPLVSLTIVLLVIFLPLALIGGILIVLLLAQCLNYLQELERHSGD